MKTTDFRATNLKATNLMIGDWLYAIDDNGETHPCRVNNLEYDYTNKRDEFSLDFYGTGFKPVCPVAFKVEPIPITPEILKQNGFKNDFYEEESVADYHTIRLEGYSLKHKIGRIDGYLVTWCNGGANVTTDLRGCIQKDISYVHELQHALKLCKIDKEITL